MSSALMAMMASLSEDDEERWEDSTTHDVDLTVPSPFLLSAQIPQAQNTISRCNSNAACRLIVFAEFRCSPLGQVRLNLCRYLWEFSAVWVGVQIKSRSRMLRTNYQLRALVA